MSDRFVPQRRRRLYLQPSAGRRMYTEAEVRKVLDAAICFMLGAYLADQADQERAYLIAGEAVRHAMGGDCGADAAMPQVRGGRRFA